MHEMSEFKSLNTPSDKPTVSLIQRCQSGLKTGVVGPILKLGVVGSKSSTDGSM